MFQEHSRLGSAVSAKPMVRPRWTVVAFLVVNLGVAIAAQTPPPARVPAGPAEGPPAAPATLPAARSILDRHIKAIGGREAVLSHSSIQATGTLTMPAAGITGKLEIYTAKPNKALVKVSLEGVGEMLEGFNGTHGWSLSPMTGPMLHEGKELQERRFDSDFYSALRQDSRYESMTTVEQTEFDKRTCYKVRLVRKTGGEDFEFYDVATGLKAGGITTRETHMGAVTSTSTETDYRPFGNLLQPTTLTQRIGAVEQVMKIAAIEYDTVQPSVFELPAGIKALVK